MDKQVQDEANNGVPPANANDGVPENVDELKKLYSESSREARYLAESKKVMANEPYLLELAKHNRPLAERIAKDDFNSSLEDALADIQTFIDSKQTAPSDKKKTASDSKAEILSVLEEMKATETFEKTMEDLWLEQGTEKAKKVVEEYEFLMEGKKSTPETVRRLLKTAYKTVVGTEAKDAKDLKKGVSAMSGNGWSGGAPADKKKSYVRDQGPASWY